MPAGLAFLLLFAGGAFAITATAATVLAGSSQAPGGSLLAHAAGRLALVTAPSFALALGVSSLLGSRSTSIGILLGWQLIAMPLLVQFPTLGVFREGLVAAATDRLAPLALIERAAVPMAVGAAAVILLVWATVPLVLGASRTWSRDA